MMRFDSHVGGVFTVRLHQDGGKLPDKLLLGQCEPPQITASKNFRMLFLGYR